MANVQAGCVLHVYDILVLREHERNFDDKRTWVEEIMFTLGFGDWVKESWRVTRVFEFFRRLV